MQEIKKSEEMQVVETIDVSDIPVNTGPTLIDLLTKMFEEEGIENPSAWEDGLPPLARTAPNPVFARYVVNSVWRHWLGCAGIEFNINTMDARYSIVDDASDEELVRLYRANVLPWIKSHNLPNALKS